MDVLLPALRNHLLAGLPVDARARLLPHLTMRRLATGDVVARPHVPQPVALFPLSGITSVVLRMQDGLSAEVCVVGSEGFVGLAPLMGVRDPGFEIFQQSPGEALSIDTAILLRELQANPPLRHLLMKYAWVTFQSVAISAACSRLHSVEQRYACWLLLSADRVGPTVTLTQDFLAQMLGVRRPTVTLLTSALRREGILHSTRGVIVIDDLPALHALACECYERHHAVYAETMGRHPRVADSRLMPGSPQAPRAAGAPLD